MNNRERVPYRQTPPIRKTRTKKGRPFLRFFLLLLIVLAVAIGLFLTHKAFDIKYIRVEGNETLPSSMIVEKMGDINNNIFLFKAGEAEEKVLELPGITEAKIEKEFPNRIVLRVKELYFIASIVADNHSYFIDQEGLVADQIPEELTNRYKPIKIEGLEENIEVGQPISEDKRIIQFLTAILKTDLSLAIDKVIFEKTDKIDIMYKDIAIHFGPPDDINEKISVLLAVIEKIEAQDIRAVEIILNEGANPIVVYDK